MNMQFTQPLIIFDVETTDPKAGMGGAWPEIIELGAVKMSPQGEILDQFQSFVQPLNLEVITEDVLRLTGISLESVTSAKPWKQQWREFAEFTSFNDITLAAWGTDYDIPCLKLAYSKAYVGYPHNVRAFDLMTFVRTYGMLTGRRFTKFSVQSIARYFGITDIQTHRALDDARLEATIVAKILGEERGPDTKSIEVAWF